jgi:hypothetical protein
MYCRYKLLKAIFNIIKANKMNPNTENIENANITENIVNTVFDLGIDLGPPPQMVRHASYDEYEEVGDVELIADGEFPDFQSRYDTPPNDFVMPTPCPKCYQMCCNEDCSEEKEELAPLALTRVLTSVDYYYYKPGQEEEPEEDLVPLPTLPSIPPPLTRSFTNSHWPQDMPDEYYRAVEEEFNRAAEENKKVEVQEGEKQQDQEDEDNYIDDYKEEYRYMYRK